MKKRFMFTLTKETVEEFQALCKEVGLPPATISNEIDRFLKEMLNTVKTIRAQGSFTLKDMFERLEQVELLPKEGVKNAPELKKEKAKRSRN